MIASHRAKGLDRLAVSIAVVLAFSPWGYEAQGGQPPGVTSESFKYLDEEGEVRFAPSWERLPEAYRSPLRWRSAAWCSESPQAGEVGQSIEFLDVDADGHDEVLVFFDDQCPNQRRFAMLEVIEADERGGFSIVATVNADRGWRPEPVDLDRNGVFELLGRRWGSAPELWVRQDGEYVDLVLGGTCFGTFWQVVTGAPQVPLEEDLARVLEIYRAGECRPDVPKDLVQQR